MTGVGDLVLAEQPSDNLVLLECAHYRYAHDTAENRAEALGAVRELLAEGVRSPGWDFSANIQRAEADGHPNVPLLRALAGVISDGDDVTRLDEFEEW